MAFGSLGPLLTRLAVTAVRAAVTAIADAIAGKMAHRDLKPDKLDPDAVAPRTHALVEHDRRMIAASVAAAREQAAKRTAITTRPPRPAKPDTLEPTEEAAPDGTSEGHEPRHD